MSTQISLTAKKHIIPSVIMCFAICLYLILDIGCPIYGLTGFPCPACGTTRALTSLVKLDLGGYFHYNPMALPLLSVFFIISFGAIRMKPFAVYSLTVAAVNFILYIIKLF